jgi:SAM-dependent methyltransferase
MWSDVVDLRDFYASRTGHVARHLILRSLRDLWPDVTGQRVLGLGYAAPYLRQFEQEAERVLAFMPAGQGVVHWPSDGPGLTALVSERDLPLPDFSIDRVLLVHAMESAESLPEMLTEIWRVLMGDGRLLLVVPNRRGIWARSDRTPFGYGRPFSPAQITRVLRDNSFMPMQTAQALFVPPTRSRTILRSAAALERAGQRWFPRFAGVVVIEARKQLYAPSASVQRKQEGRRVVVPFPQVAGRSVARGLIER